MKWVLRIFGGLLGLLVLILATAYVTSWFKLQKQFEPEADTFVASTGHDLDEALRVSRIMGCAGDCHGKDLGGNVLVDIPMVVRIAPPSLSKAAREMTDAEFERAVRQGIKTDGGSILIMPSQVYHPMTDDHLSMILELARSTPLVDHGYDGVGLKPVASIMLALGKVPLIADEVERKARITDPYADPETTGEYFAASCRACHGSDLRGKESEGAPDMRVLAAYDRDDFEVLMREGIGVGGRELDPMMKSNSLEHFQYFTDYELDALYEYLRKQ